MTDEPVGSLAEEAAKLFGALTDSRQTQGSTGEAPGEGTGDGNGEGTGERAAQGHTAERCPHTWCPVCHLAEYVHDNPELMRQITDSAAAFMASVRDVLDQFSGEEEDE